MDVERHVLFFGIRHVQQVRSDRALSGVRAKVQNHNTQHCQNYSYWLFPGFVPQRQT